MVETKTTLNEETLDALEELIEINIDSSKGFAEAAESVDDERLESLFREMADTRRQYASELRAHVRRNDEEPEDDGSVMGTIHRKWMDLRAAVNGGDATVVLIEAERGEDAIKEKYEDLLKETAGSAMNDVLMSQYSVVKSQHDKVRDLRDAYKKMD